MTIKELYEMAVEKGVENFEINIQFRDGGGFYYGYDSELVNEIDKENNIIIL